MSFETKKNSRKHRHIAPDHPRCGDLRGKHAAGSQAVGGDTQDELAILGCFVAMVLFIKR
jgi:hypothetical protein